MANRPVPRTLTRAQQARRQRVVDAAMALGLDGGYEAVQMRDVAARADVAMGTVYRYFTSKDHLLAAALVHWVEQLDARLAQLPAQGDSAAARVIDVLDRALRAMGRQPQLVGAVFTALASPDPAAIECQQQVSVLMEGIITRAIGDPQPRDISDRARILGHVWYSALVGWVNGWSNMSRVHDELVVAIGLLLPVGHLRRGLSRQRQQRSPARRSGRHRAGAPCPDHEPSSHRRRDTVWQCPRPSKSAGCPSSSAPVQAVDDLSFEVDAGRVTGFLGPNGSGKTTTLRILLGLVGANQGTATFGGRRYVDLDHPVHHVGAVLEATSFHPGRRAEDHLQVRWPWPPASPSHGSARRSSWSGSVRRGPAAGRQVLAGHAPAAAAGHRPPGRSRDAHPRRAGQRARSPGHPVAPHLHPLPGVERPRRARLLPPSLRDGGDGRRRDHRLPRQAGPRRRPSPIWPSKAGTSPGCGSGPPSSTGWPRCSPPSRSATARPAPTR